MAAGCGCDDDDDDDSILPDDDDDADDDDTGDDDTGDDDTGDDDTGDDDTGDDDDDDFIPPTTQGFVYIRDGSFQMGSPANEPGRDSDETRHDVNLTTKAEMLETEVTQSMFEDMMDYNPSHYPLFGESPNRPVENVSWYDALAYTNKLSESFGYDKCYAFSDIICVDESVGDDVDYCKSGEGIFDATVILNGVSSPYQCEGFRLPTESEWEYAARAGSTTPFHNGDITQKGCSPIDPNLDSIAWYCGNAIKTSHAVAGKQANDWGLYDMAGNVLEWTWDLYGPYPVTATNPDGYDDGYFRVARGGSHRYYAATRNRSAYRAGHSEGHRSWYLGFRVARSLSDATSEKGMEIYSTIDKPDYKGTLDLPDSLPFTYTRTDVGTPLTPQEITDFTQKITGFYKNIPFFDWVLITSHGMDVSNPSGAPDYKLYWQDTRAIKSGTTVTFEHYGGADNLMIRTSKVLNNACAGYLASGDATWGEIVKQYSKGIVALFNGMMWDEEDPEDFIMARAIFTEDHAYTENGLDVAVTYGPAKVEKYDWNAQTIPNDGNPYWIGTWVRNMRSKDDVPHIYRTVPLLMRVIEDGVDPDVVEAAEQALLYLTGFATDIMESGFYIRTKDKYGNALIPLSESGFIVADLASLELYDPLTLRGECTPKLSSSLLAYGDPLDIDCANGISYLYEAIAAYGHYFNIAINRYFHAAVLNIALTVGQNTIAYELLSGMDDRVSTFFDGTAYHSGHNDWNSDVAAYLLVAASSGLPLTSQEARHVMEQYTLSVDHYEPWTLWDLWDVSVPDGTYDYKPSRNGSPETAVRLPAMSYLLEYCYSPFKNDTTAPLVDCAIILDPTLW